MNRGDQSGGSGSSAKYVLLRSMCAPDLHGIQVDDETPVVFRWVVVTVTSAESSLTSMSAALTLESSPSFAPLTELKASFTTAFAMLLPCPYPKRRDIPLTSRRCPRKHPLYLTASSSSMSSLASPPTLSCRQRNRRRPSCCLRSPMPCLPGLAMPSETYGRYVSAVNLDGMSPPLFGVLVAGLG